MHRNAQRLTETLNNLAVPFNIEHKDINWRDNYYGVRIALSMKDADSWFHVNYVVSKYFLIWVGVAIIASTVIYFYIKHQKIVSPYQLLTFLLYLVFDKPLMRSAVYRSRVKGFL